MESESVQSEIEVFVGGRASSSLSVENPFSAGELVDPFALEADEIRKFSGLSTAFRKKTSREILKRNEPGSKVLRESAFTGYAMFDIVQPIHDLEMLARLYHASEPHSAAVQARVSNIVGLGYDFVESPKVRARMDDAGDDIEKKARISRGVQRAKIAMHEMLDILTKDDTLLEILTKVWIDYETTGNGYIEVGRRTNGEIGYIGHIPSTVLRARRSGDGYVQILNERVVFFRKFGSDVPDPIGNDPRPNEIIHFKKYSPLTTYYGVPNIIAAEKALAGNHFSEAFNLDYFENKAVPRYVITTKGVVMSGPSQRMLTEFFETNLKGHNHRSIYVPLPADTPESKVEFSMKPVEAGTQEASFGDYHATNVKLILMAHRVPINKVSSGDNISLSNARDLDKTFKEQVCRPEQLIAEGIINSLFKELTDVFTFKLNELSLTDEDTQSKIDERDIRNNIVVPNEIRSRRGMPALSDGNTTLSQKQIEGKKAGVGTSAIDQQVSGNAANGRKTRARDAQRSAGATDSNGNGRAAKGDGRTVD